MARCDVCGNDYDKAFTVQTVQGGGTFDSFECAIHALAPVCAHCGCRIIGRRRAQRDLLLLRQLRQARRRGRHRRPHLTRSPT